MDAAKAQRIYICLNELVRLAEVAAQGGPLSNRLTKLVTSSEYQEMKEWLRMK